MTFENLWHREAEWYLLQIEYGWEGFLEEGGMALQPAEEEELQAGTLSSDSRSWLPWRQPDSLGSAGWG